MCRYLFLESGSSLSSLTPHIISVSSSHQPATNMSGEKRDFNKAAATWDQKPHRVRMAQDVAQAILLTLQPGPETDVLDIGCGTGLVTFALQPHVRTVTAIDSSQGMLDELEKKVAAQGLTNVRTRLVDLEKDDLPGPVDLVASSMTFHHIKDTVLLLKRIAGILKPGGKIAIADLDSDEGKFHDSNEGVFHFGFDRHSMKKSFEAAGFVSVQNQTAAIVQKPGPDGGMRTFTVFLMTGVKEK
jgi:ubiquinone/menaquinone biosynthesis C-methylase UbiE